MREALKYANALEFGLKRLATLPVSLRLMRELDKRLLAGVQGESRRTKNWIGPPGCTLKKATFVLPPLPQMHESLKALEKYLHNRDVYPPLVRLPFFKINSRLSILLWMATAASGAYSCRSCSSSGSCY